MVKFTSTVVALSVLAGSALAAPSFSRSDDVSLSAREIEALFGREMVEYATRSPHHYKEVVEVAHAVNNVINSRRELGMPLVARDHTHTGEPHHNHPHHNHYGQGPYPHHHHSHPTGDAPVPAPVTADTPPVAPVADAGTNGRREYLEARDHTHTGEPHHNHPHHNHYGQGPYPHHHHSHPTGDAPVPAPVTADTPPVAPVADAGTNSRRSYDDYYDSFVARDGPTDGTVDASASSGSAAAPPVVHHQHPHQHPVHQHFGGNPEAMRHLHETIARIRAKQEAAGIYHPHQHPHQHMHNFNGNGPHPHQHMHSHSAGVSAPPVADAAAPAPVQPGRRSLDADELYARYFEFDELD